MSLFQITRARLVELGSTLVAAGLFIYFLATRDFGFGVDPGLHHAFAEELARGGQWPIGQTYNLLGGLADYPPGAHLLAIIAGAPFSSTLQGIFIVTAGAVVLGYLALFGISRHHGSVHTTAALAVFIVIILATRKSRAYLGNEIIENFFFSQLVGTSTMLFAFLVLVRMRGAKFTIWVLVAVAATHILAWVYPLSAVQFAAAAVFLQMIEVEDMPRQAFIKTTSTTAALGISILLHPTFYGMVLNAAHNGDIVFAGWFIALLIVGTSTATVFLSFNRPIGERRFGPLSALAFGLCAVATLQAVAYYGLGLGSPYAIKKHGFAIGTVGAMIAAHLFTQLPAINRFLSKAKMPNWVSPFSAIVSCVFLVLVVGSVFIARRSAPVAEMVRYDKELRQLMSAAESNKFLGSNAFSNVTLPAHQNFTVAAARLQQTRGVIDQQHRAILKNQDNASVARYVIVSDTVTTNQNCIMATSTSLKIIRADCAKLRDRE